MTAPKVVFVGLDAMDPDIVNRMVDDGRLPTLGALRTRAFCAPTTNPVGLLVGGCWPTIWSSTSPATHGFYCFRQFVSGRYEIRRFTPDDIDVPPFWMPLADAGRSVALLDVPLVRETAPAGGVHVVDLGTHDRMLEPSSVPAPLLQELVDRHGPHPVEGKCDDYSHEGRWQELVDVLVAATEWRADVSLDLLARGDWDLFATVFSESHCVGHQFWWLHDPSWPSHDPTLAAELGGSIGRVYEAIDTSLGRILETADHGTHVAVLQSHGMGVHFDGDHVFGEIVQRLEDARGGASTTARLRELGLRRARRAVRSVQHRRHPDDRRYRQVTAVDGSRRFFPMPNNELFAALRLNLRGREPRGCVRPGAEADELLQWLADELGQLVDPDTGRPVVRRVHRIDDLYEGPLRDHLPDLLVDWERSGPIRAAASPTIGVVRGTYGGIRTGDHRPNGQLLLVGPEVQPGLASRPIDSRDVAPTLCRWLGVELPDAEGSPIPEATAASQT